MNPFGDFIPGINIGAGIDQLFTGRDRDILAKQTNSNRPGQFQANWLPDPGVKKPTKGNEVTANKGVTPGPAPSGPALPVNGGGGGGAGGGVTAADLAFLDDNAAQLRSLLGRTNTGLAQALARNQDQYNEQVGQANADKERQYAAYGDKRVETNKGKLGAYDELNRNAGNGYRSLAQIIGRASGTGSSAFRELLPDVIGKDTSSKRSDITDTYGENLASIDKAQKQYDLDFESVLADLARQRSSNEESARAGIESQRQNINQQLAQVAAQKAQAQGGGYDAVRAAQAPFRAQIENSRNAVESFFNQFRTQYTPRQAVAATPDLAQYQVDRAAINAENTGGLGENPYSDLIRRRLQEGTLV